MNADRFAEFMAVAYLQHRAFIFNYIAARMTDLNETEDLAQEVFCRAWASYTDGRYRTHPDGMRPWLTVIARNVALDYTRSGWYRNSTPIDFTDSLNQSIELELAVIATQTEVCVHDTETPVVRELMNRLTDLQRECLELFVCAGWTHKEVAAEIGSTPDRVSAMLHLAKGSMRRLLAPRAPQQVGKCSVEGCDRSRATRGRCGTHYKRWLRTGETGGPLPKVATRICDEGGCDEPVLALGLCSRHYQQRRNAQVPA